MSWFNCDVERVGPGWGTNIYISLTHLASPSNFTRRWFIARDDQKREMLDTALMAVSHNHCVQVHIEGDSPDPDPYSVIEALYLRKFL
jgi:hypothetical protein